MNIKIDIADDTSAEDFIEFQTKLSSLCSDYKHIISQRTLNFLTLQEKNKFLTS